MRKEVIGAATLYLGDCMEILPTLPRVDAVVTDPPYGVREDEWDAMSEHDFAAFSMGWLAQAKRISPELMSFGYLDNAVHRLTEMLYTRVRPLIWSKPAGSQLTGASERNRWFAFEAVFHCYEPETFTVVEPRDAAVGALIRKAREAAGLSRGAVDFIVRGKKTGLCYRWEEGACLPTGAQVALMRGKLDLGDDFEQALQDALEAKARTLEALAVKTSQNAADKSDVLPYRTMTGGLHPCEKPVALMQDLIECSGGSLSTICDPFMGSGSTGVACVNLGRSFIGVEKDPRYFDIACKRIDTEQRQGRLIA
jgi:hypothetical protein